MRAADAERRILRRWTVVAFAMVIIATLAVAATYTTVFAAKHIELRGSHRIPRAEVLSLAHVNDRSNVFHLDASAVERRLERDPRILDAQVTTSLPDGLMIQIVQRMPVAVVGTPEALVGADGVVIGPAGDAVDRLRVAIERHHHGTANSHDAMAECGHDSSDDPDGNPHRLSDLALCLL